MFPPDFILEVARSAGLDPKRSGAEYLVPCPWAADHKHGDADPSCRLNPEKNTFYCDPCGRGGGVLEFANLLGIEIEREIGASPKSSRKAARKKKLSFVVAGPITEQTQRLIKDLLGKHYTPEAWAKIGVLEGAVSGQPAIGFPLPSGGFKVCLYRCPDPKRGKPYSFRFADGGKADLLVVGDDREVLLVAGEWDMLAALSAGFEYVATGTGGEGTWKPEWNERLRGKEVLVTYDADADGRRGSRKVAMSLAQSGNTVFIVELPLSNTERDGKDLSDYLALHEVAQLKQVLTEAQAKGAYRPDPAEVQSSSGGSPFEQIRQILRFVSDDSNAEFKSGVFQRVLPILASLKPADRDLISREVKSKLGLGLAVIRQEIELFRVSPEAATENADDELEVSADAIALLEDPDLIARLLKDTTELGVVGEEHNKVSLLLAMTSRKCDKPMDVIVKGESSAGKNYVVAGVASLFPPADVVNATNLSPQSLSYWDGDLIHKILLICETEGAERAEYDLRVLQSEGRLIVHYVTKVNGELKTVEKIVEGPAATITTTTRESIHPENETRLLEIAIDDSVEQTVRIIALQKKQRSGCVDKDRARAICELWRGAQSALEPAPVVIPFAEAIDFPTCRVRARRDLPKLLTLVEASAFIHQRQREHRDVAGRIHIVADLKDYTLAYDLMHSFIERVQAGLNDRETRVLRLLQEASEGEQFTVRNVADRLGWHGESGRKRAKRCLDGLADKGFADSTEPQSGKATLYWFRKAPSPEESGISTPAQVAEAWGQPGHLDTTWTSPLSRSKELT